MEGEGGREVKGKREEEEEEGDERSGQMVLKQMGRVELRHGGGGRRRGEATPRAQGTKRCRELRAEPTPTRRWRSERGERMMEKRGGGCGCRAGSSSGVEVQRR